MKVILKKQVPKLGQEWDIVIVKDGFARNFLLPKGLANPATPSLIKIAEVKKEERLKKLEEVIANAKEIAKKLKDTVLTLKKKAKGEKLYGSVKDTEIVDLLTKDHKVEVTRDMIRLKEPIKTLGEHKVLLHLAEGVDAEITVKIEEEK